MVTVYPQSSIDHSTLLTQQHLALGDYHTEYSAVDAATEWRKDQEMSNVAVI
jgi:hypothetical protein